jgi:hypothetical protein
MAKQVSKIKHTRSIFLFPKVQLTYSLYFSLSSFHLFISLFFSLFLYRWFVLYNGFLNYYNTEKSKGGQLLAAISLKEMKDCEPLDMQTGDFALVHEGDDATYSLKAPNGKILSEWVDAIVERIEYAKSSSNTRKEEKGSKKSSASSSDKSSGTQKKRGGRRGSVDDDDDEEDAPRRRRGGGGGGRRSSMDDDDEDEESGGKRGRSIASKTKPIRKNEDDEEDEDLRLKPKVKQQPSIKDIDEDDDNGPSNKQNTLKGGNNGVGSGALLASKGLGGGRRTSQVDSDEEATQISISKRDENTKRKSSLDGGGGVGNLAGGRRNISRVDNDSEDEAPRGAGAQVSRKRTDFNNESGRNRERNESPSPSAPPAPEMEGWAKKKANTKMGDWQARYLRLVDGILYFAEDHETTEFTNVIDVSKIVKVFRAPAQEGSKGVDRKAFVISTNFQPDVLLRAADEAAAVAWVSKLTEAGLHKAQYGSKRNKNKKNKQRVGRNRGRTESDDNDENNIARGDSSFRSEGADSDDDNDDGHPPPPSWYIDYNNKDESRWVVATQKTLNRLFEDIYKTKDDDKNSGGGGGGEIEEAIGNDDGEKKVVISKLVKATTKACAELEDRVMELRMRERNEVIKHFLQFFDQMFLNELTALTTGRAAESLSGKQILQLIDCIEGYGNVRKRSLGTNLQLSSQEQRPWQLLLESRQFLIQCYMETMGPKLHSISEKVLSKLTSERDALVREVQGERLGTRSPTDLFTIMSEHLQIAKTGGSTNLQRKLLSAVMVEVVFFAQTVYTDMLDSWLKQPDNMSVDFVIAVINDAGITLDHIEQLEAYFADALTQESNSNNQSVGVLKNGNGLVKTTDEMDPFERDEAEQARENLAAVEQDIPRAKEQLLHCAFQLTGVLVDMITDDSKRSFAALFSKDWETGAVVTGITELVTDYFLNTIGRRLDPFFYERVCSMVLAHIVEQYLLRLLVPETLRKDKKNPFKGGFSRSFKVTEDRLKQIAHDVVEIGRCFSFMPREDLHHILSALKTAMEMMTSDPDTLLTIMEVAIRNNPSASTQIYLALDRCVEMREDLSKKEKIDARAEAKKVLLEVGEPPEEDDDLFSGQTGGVMHGVSMAQGMEWRPAHVTIAIYKSIFPQAVKEAQVLFAGWEPRIASPRASTSIPAEEINMNAFLSGASGSPLPAASSKSSSKSRRNLEDEDDFSSSSKSDINKGGGIEAPTSSAPTKASSAFSFDSAAAKTFTNLFSVGTKASATKAAPAPTPAVEPPSSTSGLSFGNTSKKSEGGGRRRRGRRGDDDDD